MLPEEVIKKMIVLLPSVSPSPKAFPPFRWRRTTAHNFSPTSDVCEPPSRTQDVPRHLSPFHPRSISPSGSDLSCLALSGCTVVYAVFDHRVSRKRLRQRQCEIDTLGGLENTSHCVESRGSPHWRWCTRGSLLPMIGLAMISLVAHASCAPCTALRLGSEALGQLVRHLYGSLDRACWLSTAAFGHPWALAAWTRAGEVTQARATAALLPLPALPPVQWCGRNVVNSFSGRVLLASSTCRANGAGIWSGFFPAAQAIPPWWLPGAQVRYSLAWLQGGVHALCCLWNLWWARRSAVLAWCMSWSSYSSRRSPVFRARFKHTARLDCVLGEVSRAWLVHVAPGDNCIVPLELPLS